MTTAGERFLKRVLNEGEATPQQQPIKYDSIHKTMLSKLNAPLYASDVLDLFVLSGIAGRFINTPDMIVKLKETGDLLRQSATIRKAFFNFVDILKSVKLKDAPQEEAKKRGGIVQQLLEAVLVKFGLPEDLVAAAGGKSIVISSLNKTITAIEDVDGAESALRILALRLGITVSTLAESVEQLNEFVADKPSFKVNDEFMDAIHELVLMLGVPEAAIKSGYKSMFVRNVRNLKRDETQKPKLKMLMQRVHTVLSDNETSQETKDAEEETAAEAPAQAQQPVMAAQPAQAQAPKSAYAANFKK
jgi:hypothetical protein